METPETFIIISNLDLINSNKNSTAIVDENCACADSANVLEAIAPVELLATPLYVKPAVYVNHLDKDTFVVFNPVGSGGPVVVNQAAAALLEWFATPQSLSNLGVDTARRRAAEQLVALDLLEPVGTQRRLQRGETQTLVAWLHTTNACNLRCTYCYVDKNEEAMSAETGVAAVAAIFRTAQQHGYRQVKLKYAGGEATLNFKLIEQLHHEASRLAEASGIRLHEVILSNGVALTNAMLDFVRAAGIGLTISLDGLGEGHDAQRVFVNGRGSAKLVKRTIERAVERGVAPHLSITVTGRNGEDVVAAVRFAVQHQLLFNLNFYRENDLAQEHPELVAEDERLIATIERCFEAIAENPPQHSLLPSLVDRANFGAPHEHACGAGHSYLVVNQQGAVARCQMELEQPVSDIWAADPLQEIRLYAKGFQNTSIAEKAGCRECEWRYWCAGGCPKLTHRVTGRNDVKSPYCRVYKAIYPQLLNLEAQRMLQHYICGEVAVR